MASALRQEIDELEKWYSRNCKPMLPVIQSVKEAIIKAEADGTELPASKYVDRLRALRNENDQQENVTSITTYRRDKKKLR